MKQEVCFIATSNLYDWRGIQIDMFVEILLAGNTKTKIFVGADRVLPSCNPAPGGKSYQPGFAIFSSMEIKLRELEVWFIAKSKIFDLRGIQIGTFSHLNHTKIHVHFFRFVQTRHFLHCWVCDII